MKRRLLTVIGLLILSVSVPLVGVIVCGVILAVQITLMGVRQIVAHLPTADFRTSDGNVLPIFSIHVATHSEPPDLVIRTLQALLDQDWPSDRYEIIVMDNNTSDSQLWKPVEEFCLCQKGPITFLHRTGVVGAKAGALNIALKNTRRDATHIVTVDADYIVCPNFLTIAGKSLARTGADYVQFPQSYIKVADTAAGVDAELEEYFRSNATAAGEAEAVLLTGTLCVISRNSLIAAGGWSGTTTTEDAEVGVRLCNAGFAGRFIDQVVGQGLLPFTLNDLEKQRYRWCSGNFETLLHHSKTIFTHVGSLTFRKRLVIISQLTAWFNLALVPAFLLLVSSMLNRDGSVVQILAASIIVLTALDIVVRVTGRGLRDRFAIGVMLQAISCRLALAPRAAKATFDAMLGKELSFVVTNKSDAVLSSANQVPVCHLILFAVSLAVIITSSPSHPLVIAALAMLMLPLPAAILTDIRLRAYRDAITFSRMEGTS